MSLCQEVLPSCTIPGFSLDKAFCFIFSLALAYTSVVVVDSDYDGMFLPSGRTVFEIGTEKDVKGKANRDYNGSAPHPGIFNVLSSVPQKP